MHEKPKFKPGELLNMVKAGHAQKALKLGGIKHSGQFGGKSNALGHGGRAAQLKARGVPGGVIGILARRAGAAPGGPNYHGKKAKSVKPSLEMAMKKAHKKRKKVQEEDASHDFKKSHKKHKKVQEEDASHDFKCKVCGKKTHKTSEHKGKHYKKAKHSAGAIKGLKEFVSEEEKEKRAKKKSK